jgi:hypothetical protein
MQRVEMMSARGSECLYNMSVMGWTEVDDYVEKIPASAYAYHVVFIIILRSRSGRVG